jgi:excisionase family DNA binding protein
MVDEVNLNILVTQMSLMASAMNAMQAIVTKIASEITAGKATRIEGKAAKRQEKKSLTTKEAAAYINRSMPTLYRLRGEGKLHPTKPNGGKLRWSKADLDKFIENPASSSIAEKATAILNGEAV